MTKNKQTVNLEVFHDLRARGYTQASIAAAMGCSVSKIRTCMRNCLVEETGDVPVELDHSKLIPLTKPRVDIDMDELMEKFENGESLRDLSDEYGVAYSTLWHRVDTIINA